jgi:hypothetical protein
MKSQLSRRILLLAAALCGLAPSLDAQVSAELDTEEKKTLYALGAALGRNLGSFNLSTEERVRAQAPEPRPRADERGRRR